MSQDSSNYKPTVHFYIGDDEEDYNEVYSDIYVSTLSQIWDDVSTWEDGYKPPVEIGMKILRILRGLNSSPPGYKQTVCSYNSDFYNQTSKVSAALQEYKELIYAQVSSDLEEKDGLEYTEMKEEIKQIKTEIDYSRLPYIQKNQQVYKGLDCALNDLSITSRENKADSEP